MNVLVFCPDALSREAIAHEIIELGNDQLFFAETERLVVSIALYNPIHVVLLFDPPNTESLIDLKQFLRQKRPKMRIRLLPEKRGVLLPGWRGVISTVLKPAKKRTPKQSKIHPRFRWKPSN